MSTSLLHMCPSFRKDRSRFDWLSVLKTKPRGHVEVVVVTHFWVPTKYKINSQKRLEKKQEAEALRKWSEKLVKEVKNTKMEFLTIYS